MYPSSQSALVSHRKYPNVCEEDVKTAVNSLTAMAIVFSRTISSLVSQSPLLSNEEMFNRLWQLACITEFANEALLKQYYLCLAACIMSAMHRYESSKYQDNLQGKLCPLECSTAHRRNQVMTVRPHLYLHSDIAFGAVRQTLQAIRYCHRH